MENHLEIFPGALDQSEGQEQNRGSVGGQVQFQWILMDLSLSCRVQTLQFTRKSAETTQITGCHIARQKRLLFQRNQLLNKTFDNR